jgi:hypothetical protein
MAAKQLQSTVCRVVAAIRSPACPWLVDGNRYARLGKAVPPQPYKGLFVWHGTERIFRLDKTYTN